MPASQSTTGAATPRTAEAGLPPDGPLPPLDRLIRVINRALVFLAGIALAAMMLVAVADMVLRRFGITMAGSYEVIGWLSAAAMALALGAVQQQRGHVGIELVIDRLGPKLRSAVDLLMSLLALLLFAATSWYLTAYGFTLQETGSLSETLRAVVYPWVYVVAAGAAGLTLALLADFLRAAGSFLSLLQRHA
ncbi:TRAP transporter small permease [Piscinibacter sakaiensis]|uniref:TRAP transporter small permease n=1 Tax=Piscinibacter sakaiensis TaxID=1547922 RepID=UPI003AAD310C